MISKKISNFEFATLNYFIIRAFLIGITFNALINIMKQDSWIIPIISIIPGIIFILFMNSIMNYEPDLDISEKIIKLFNKTIGKIIIIIVVLFAFAICILNYLTLNNFIKSQFLIKTPILVISIMFAITSLYILSKGINTICRTGNILFYISIIFGFLSFLGLLPSCQIDNLKPFFTSSLQDYTSGLNFYYGFNIIPIFILTIIPKNKIHNEKVKSTLIISYLFSAFSLFIIILQTVSIFGYELSRLYEYPEFLVLKHFSLFGLTSRLESILIMQLLFDIFIFNIFIIYFMGNNIKTIFNSKKTNLIYIILCILIIIATEYALKGNIYIDNLIKNYIPNILSIVSTIIVLLIWIKTKISKH